MSTYSVDLLEKELSDPRHIVFIVSYPNSGRTWLRAILSRYKQQLLAHEPFNIKLHALYSEEPYSPQYVFYHAGAADIPEVTGWQRILKPRGISYPFDISLCAESRLILLYRDPRDALVSNYHELATRQGRFKGSLSHFVHNHSLGIERWIEFHNFVIEQRPLDSQKTITIRYQDLSRKSEETLSRILTFSGTDIIPEAMSDALAFSSFENMNKLEMTNQLIRPAHPAAHHDPEKRKVRKGAVGGYKSVLSQMDIDFIDAQLIKGLNTAIEIDAV